MSPFALGSKALLLLKDDEKGSQNATTKLINWCPKLCCCCSKKCLLYIVVGRCYYCCCCVTDSTFTHADSEQYAASTWLRYCVACQCCPVLGQQRARHPAPPTRCTRPRWGLTWRNHERGKVCLGSVAPTHTRCSCQAQAHAIVPCGDSRQLVA